jgi:hypothetical protein
MKHKDNFIFFLKTSLMILIKRRGASKVMPPILLCWPMTLKMDAGRMVIEGEPSSH